MDQGELCELASAAYYLDIKNLVNLTSRVIATQISGKSGEELRDTFGALTGAAADSELQVAAPDVAALTTRARLHKKLESKRRPPDERVPAGGGEDW